MNSVDAVIDAVGVTDGYYYVYPLVGSSERVLAVDLTREGLTVGKVYTLVQVGSEYGILPRNESVSGIIQVDDSVVDALKEEAPAQFACLYVAHLLGRGVRLYDVATVTAISQYIITAQIFDGADKGKLISAVYLEGLYSTDFTVGEKILIQKKANLYTAIGWWEPKASPPLGFIVGFADINEITVLDEFGNPIPNQAVECTLNIYDYDGSIEGTPGVYVSTTVSRTSDIDGKIQITQQYFLIPVTNTISLRYDHAGKRHTADLNINGSATATGNHSITFFENGSAVEQFTAFDRFQFGDFDVELIASATMPPDSVNPSPNTGFGQAGTLSINSANGEWTSSTSAAGFNILVGNCGGTMVNPPITDGETSNVLYLTSQVSGTAQYITEGETLNIAASGTGTANITFYLYSRPYTPTVETL